VPAARHFSDVATDSPVLVCVSLSLPALRIAVSRARAAGGGPLHRLVALRYQSARPAAARSVSGGRHQTFSLGGLGTAARSGMRRTRSSCSPAPFLFLQFIFYFSLGSASISHPLSHLPLAVILFSLAHWPGLELSSGGSGSARAPTSITARSSAAVSTGAVVPAGLSVRVHAGRSVDRDRRPSS